MNAWLNTNLVLKRARSSLACQTRQDPELWELFRNGDREALNAIFEKYVRLLYAYGRNITPDQGLICDCIQDVFVELWVKREMVAPKINSTKYYLIKSVRRRIGKRLWSDSRIIGQPIPEGYCRDVEFNIEVDLIQKQLSHEIALHLKTSVSSLSRGQQEAIYLKFYENMTYEQIASVMDINVKAVYNLIGKSIIALRKFFKRHPMVRE